MRPNTPTYYQTHGQTVLWDPLYQLSLNDRTKNNLADLETTYYTMNEMVHDSRHTHTHTHTSRERKREIDEESFMMPIRYHQIRRKTKNADINFNFV